MKIDQREKLIRRYLLGELDEADQTAFERELLIDRGKFDQVWAVENELIDNYVRGQISCPVPQRFESHYLASPLHRERVAIAELFLTKVDRMARETFAVCCLWVVGCCFFSFVIRRWFVAVTTSGSRTIRPKILHLPNLEDIHSESCQD
jgi:hypothetical protein